MNRTFFTAVAVVFSAAACASGTTRSADQTATYALPDDGWKSGYGVLLAGPSGEFRATLTPRGACASMRDQAVPFSFSWPTGFRVRFNPTQLLDPAGHVIANEGDVIKSAGGFTGQTAGGRGKPTRPIVHTWCGRPGEPVFAVQGAVQRVD
jgi:hypothetical protein